MFTKISSTINDLNLHFFALKWSTLELQIVTATTFFISGYKTIKHATICLWLLIWTDIGWSRVSTSSTNTHSIRIYSLSFGIATSNRTETIWNITSPSTAHFTAIPISCCFTITRIWLLKVFNFLHSFFNRWLFKALKFFNR